MSWPLVYKGELNPDWEFEDLSIGEVYSVDPEKFRTEDGYFKLPAQYTKHLSDYYHQNNSHRLPLFVVVPTLYLFCLDGQCHSSERGYYGGWTITGTTESVDGRPMTLTCSPSINIGGTYHGWLGNGILSDDCEGRKYDEHGDLQK